MKIKPVYIQVPGSKYTTIQFEMPGRTTVNDINMFLCSSFCEAAQPIQNPHIAAYYAYVIQQMRIGVQGLKNKKDIPVQLNYGVFANLVIVSVSFISDNSFFRLISKMLAEKCFLKNIKPAVQMLNHVYKEFVREKGRDNIEESMRWCQKSVEVLVLSKMDVNKFQGSEDSIGHKALTLKINTLSEAVELTKTLPIDSTMIKIDPEQYVRFSNASVNEEAYLALLLSSLNGQRVPYHCNTNELYFVKRQLNAQHKEQTVKYIKERLSFTSKKKQKSYASLSAEAKKKTSESEFNKKQKLTLHKKETALLQVVAQTAAVPHKYIQALHNKIESINVDKITKILTDIKDDLDVVVKAK